VAPNSKIPSFRHSLPSTTTLLLPEVNKQLSLKGVTADLVLRHPPLHHSEHPLRQSSNFGWSLGWN